MAQFLVRNSLNPNKVIKLGISFSKLVNKPEMTGDNIWVVEIGTAEPNKNGGIVPPVYLNIVNLETLDEEIATAVAFISAQVDWGNVLEDSDPPYVAFTNINSAVAAIDSSVVLDLKEFMPSSGIDKSSIRLTVNDIDVTNETFMAGNPYNYVINWYPRQRIRSTFN